MNDELEKRDAEGREMSNWIDTEQQRPPLKQMVVLGVVENCCGDDEINGNDAFVTLGCLEMVDERAGVLAFVDACANDAGFFYATHWMPLPAPPKR